MHPLLAEVGRAGDSSPLGVRGGEVESLGPEGGRGDAAAGDEQHAGVRDGRGELPRRGQARADGPGSGPGIQYLHGRSGDRGYGSADEEEPVPVGGGGRRGRDGDRRGGKRKRGPPGVREQEEEERGRGGGWTEGEEDVGLGAAEGAARGEEGLRVAAHEGVERAGDEGQGWVRGARQERDAVDGQVVWKRRDEAPADLRRRLRRRGGLGGHG